VIGYAASALVVASLAMTSILKLRVIGLVGSLTFLVYSVLIEAYPIAITNVIIAVIHAWNLYRLRRRDEVFTVLQVAPSSRYLEYFCGFHSDEIRTFVPGWTYRPQEDQVSVFVLRDLVPAGLLIATPSAGGDLVVHLDFVIPQYRDFKIGRFVYSRDSGIFRDLGAARAVATAGTPAHARYLEKMGYRRCPGEQDRYEFDLAPLREDRVGEP
jgi:hypothetical protein